MVVKKIVLLLAFAMLASMLVGLPNELVAGEQTDDHIIQTLSSIIEIRTLQDLDNIRNNLDGHYVLMNDIDAYPTSKPWSSFWNGGEGWEPIGASNEAFNGILDGNGYVISGLFINRPSAWYVGLFSNTTENSTIMNLGLIDLDITCMAYGGGLVGVNHGSLYSCYVSGEIDVWAYSGGLVAINGGIIYQCHFEGAIQGFLMIGGLVGGNVGEITLSYSSGQIVATDEGESGMGGLVGFNGGAIRQSYSNTDVLGNDTSNSYGGLVGRNDGTIIHSYATGNVAGLVAGGLVGYNREGKVIESYSTGNVSGYEDYHGGLIGYSDQSSIVRLSYWDIQSSGMITSNGGIGKTTAEMKQQNTFILWNFHIWLIEPGVTYPLLRYVAKNVNDIVIDAQPSRVDYSFGDRLDLSGLRLKIHYSDGSWSIDTMRSDFITYPLNGQVLTHDDTVVLGVHIPSGKTFIIPLNVQPIVEGLIIAEQPRLNYVFGENIDLTDLVVNMSWSNGSYQNVSYDEFASYGLTTNFIHGNAAYPCWNNVTVTHSASGLNVNSEPIVIDNVPVYEPSQGISDICTLPFAIMLIFGMTAVAMRRR